MRKVLLFFISIISYPVFGQIYRTQALSSDIHTIEISVNGDKERSSIMRLGMDEHIELSFDRISDDAYNRLRYKIYHCDANWNQSKGISEIEYIDGFNDNLLDDYETSLNTTVEYAHFDLHIPNDDINLKLSGNYVIEIYDEEDLNTPLLNACFSIEERLVNIGYKLTSNTDVDANKEHQQLFLDILYPNFEIREPINDIKVYVYQNNRLDTERILTKPTSLGHNKLSYGSFQNLIFKAGNEYRRFETSSYKYNGMNVAHIQYDKPNYSMLLEHDKVRANWIYNYDQDQNGRFYIRNKDGDNDKTEADYFITHFSLKVDQPLPYDIYVNGDFTNNTFSDDYKMDYDPEYNEYYLLLLLKQGLYNYQYLVNKDDEFVTSPIEGNYYETENEYSVKVYYRPTGQRYDRLIGSTRIHSRVK